MQFALVNNIKTSPVKGLKGICCSCGKDVIAKCSNIKAHYWAHIHLKDCDSWQEPETEWHREWKAHFPVECQEISFTDNTTGEIHRADVYTQEGVTLEFQNSPISLDELKSREFFYKKLIWVVNAKKFEKQIIATCNLPDPESSLLNNWDFAVDQNGFCKHIIFHRKDDLLGDNQLVRAYPLYDVELKDVKSLVDKTGMLYRALIWKYKHIAWLEAKTPVFLDFGHEYLYWLKCRKQKYSQLRYLQAIKKTDFIKKYSGL